MQPAYFIGFTLPKGIDQVLAGCQQKYFDNTYMRPVLQPHITLVHPGALFTITRQHFIQTARPVLVSHLPVTAQITNVAMFGSHSIVLAVDSNSILDLHQALVSKLPHDVKARYFVGKPFLPHITILQAQPGQSLPNDLFLKIQNHAKPLISTNFTLKYASIFRQTAARRYVTEPIFC